MNEGIEKGELCNRNGCGGIIDQKESESGCSCHINPPCSFCQTPREFCETCGWDAKEEQDSYYVRPTKEQEEAWEKERERFDAEDKLFWSMFSGNTPPDKLRIKYESHTHFSMKKIGVFPHGTQTQESLLKEIRGTFGGRFEVFNDITGKFSYIAYTD